MDEYIRKIEWERQWLEGPADGRNPNLYSKASFPGDYKKLNRVFAGGCSGDYFPQ